MAEKRLVKQEIEQLQKDLPTDQYPVRKSSDLLRAVAWTLVLLVTLSIAAIEVSSAKKGALTKTIGNLALPLIGAYFAYARAVFSWEAPKREAFEAVADEAWDRHHTHKEQEESGCSLSEPGEQPPPKAAGG